MPILPHTANGAGKSYNYDPMLVHGSPIPPSSTILSLSLTINQQLSFKARAAKASAKLRASNGRFWSISTWTGASPGSLHRILSSVIVPQFRWGSEAWWTGASHVLNQVTPSYHVLERMITGLPRWCPQPSYSKKRASPLSTSPCTPNPDDTAFAFCSPKTVTPARRFYWHTCGGSTHNDTKLACSG